MRFGVALPHYDTSLGGKPFSWPDLGRVARLAEESGFDSIWVSDHLFLDWSKYGGPEDRQGTVECWTALAALGAATDRVRLGTLALCNDFRNPGLLAKMAATLDLLSRGRLDLGLGAGWYEPEYAAAGIAFDRAGARIDRLGESVGLIARLLEGEEVTHDGDHYRMEGAVCRPGPHQRPRPPIWIGGKGDRLLRTAARVADGWNFSWLGSFDAYRERSAFADRACEEQGRDPRLLRRSVGAYVLAGRDERDLRERHARVVERTPPGVLDGESFEDFASKRVVGTVQEVADRLGSLEELGVEEIIVSFGVLPFQMADEDDMMTFAAEVAAKRR